MRLTHRVVTREPVSAAVDAAYEAEVQRSVQKAERIYQKAVRALARAERTLRHAHQAHDRRAIKVATALAEIRRAELEALEAEMRSAPASAVHRGVRSFRPVPFTRGSLL